MSSQDDPVQVYRELSDWYERRGEPPMRDRFLVLAADAALRAGRTEEAERLRFRLLKLNPHHMLKPYSSFTQAMQAPDVQTYLRDLRLNYPPEVALVLLNSLRATGVKIDAPPSEATVNQTIENDDGTVILDEPAEQFKVYPDQPETELTETAALPKELIELTRRTVASSPQSTTPLPPPRSPTSPRNTPRPQPAPPVKRKPAPAPWREPTAASVPSPYPPGQDPETGNSGGWFAVGLFVVVFLIGLVLTGYLIVRPFLM